MSFADAVRFVHTLQNRSVNELLVLEHNLRVRSELRQIQRRDREEKNKKQQQEKARAFCQLL